jgi:hypothetical protein
VRRSADSNIVKFPIGRVVREHRTSYLTGDTEYEVIVRAGISVRRAIRTLRRQEATLTLMEARARKKQTPEEHARIVERHMQYIYAQQDEERAADSPPPDAGARRAIRKLVDSWDAAAGGGDDGGSAA